MKPASILLCLVLYGMTAPAFAEDKEPTIQQVYETLNAGEHDEALALMDIVLHKHPDSAKAHFVDAEVLADMGNFADAGKEFDHAKQLDPAMQFAQPDSLRFLQNKINMANQWHYVNHRAALDQLLTQEKGAGKKIVLFFSADWSVTALPLFDELQIPQDKLAGFSFVWVDMTRTGPAQEKMQDEFDVTGVPAFILLDDGAKEIPGKRYFPVKPYRESFVAWLDGADKPAPRLKAANPKASSKNDNNDGVDVTLAETPEGVDIKLTLLPAYSLYADRISLSIDLNDLDRKDVHFGQQPELVQGDLFGPVNMFTKTVSLHFDKASLRQSGCHGKGKLLLKYQAVKDKNILLIPSRRYYDLAC